MMKKTFSGPLSTILACIRDGPKFGRRRSSAEEFGRIFGSVRLGNVKLLTSLGLWIGGVLRSSLALTKVNTLTI